MRLFFNGNDIHYLIEFHHSVTFRITDVIGVNNSSIRRNVFFQQFIHSDTIKDVVAQNKRYRIISDKGFSDDKSLRETIWLRLLGIGKSTAQLTSVSK
ncbi:hypothetical protein D3C80_1808540 [compost metagenome]